MVAYPRSRDNIEVAWSALNDGPIAMPNEMAYPWKLPSVAGDFVMASRKRKVAPCERHVIRFRERDDFTGPTAGHHFKQLLVDGAVVWDQDVAGGGNEWSDVSVDIAKQTSGEACVTVSLRMLEKQGVGDFGVCW